ncbi:hypothetical protein [Burkholderia pseudomallei]|uniref:hypothetical protein n=1 Tax=Burkholderia pseudomallei TaxID=28450 RepID=UPI0018A1BE30|nr:hypothetical protein [Burkholderia pseudomallei]
MDQSLGARRREISTSLRTKTVENCRVENALWRIVAAGSLPADSAADGAREARAANRFQPRCRISDGFGKAPPDQRVGRRMLRMSTSLPTKVVEKAMRARCPMYRRRMPETGCRIRDTGCADVDVARHAGDKA